MNVLPIAPIAALGRRRLVWFSLLFCGATALNTAVQVPLQHLNLELGESADSVYVAAAAGASALRGDIAALEAFVRRHSATSRQLPLAPLGRQRLDNTSAEATSADFESSAKPSPEAKEKDELARMPADQRAMYFRPVSVTLYCVMILTIECLLVFTLHSISRNAEELAGLTAGSLFSETLSCASRSTAYPPMICMLFVACRMFVLATTEGLGEPPIWVKTGMVIATLGMTFQFLVIFLLPLASENRIHHGLKLSELAGEPTDVHPMLWAHKYHSEGLRSLVWGVQATSMACIYSGLVAVILGIATFPAQTTQVSVAVKCTVWLSVLYFSLFLALWILRTIAEVRFPTPHKLFKAKSAALSTSMMLRKVPMYAVIFLAARMRALELDPPHGLPPVWAQACFYAITVSLFFEAIAAAYVGATGFEESDRSYYGAYVFTADPKAHAAQHFFAFVGYAGLIPVTFAIHSMKGADGKAQELEPFMKALLQLSILFFAVQILQTCIFMYEDILKKSLRKWACTVLAACSSVGMCPLLGVLFLACRMRARQITNQQGAPPAYAQHCMYMCAFATFLQFFCCMILPLFTNAPTKVDEDGAPTYEMHPMVQAYIVTITRYFSLVMMHGGVLGICIAVFTMTPENATGADKEALLHHKSVMRSIGVGAAMIFLVMLLSSAKVVGLAVKIAIESVDELFLGVQITVGKASLDICRGAVSIGNLVVHNPEPQEGHEWTSPHLLRCDRVLIDIDVWKLITSVGKVVEIQEIRLEDVNVAYDKPSLKCNSNVSQVVEFLTKGGKETSAETQEASKSKDSAAKPSTPPKDSAAKPSTPSKDAPPAQPGAAGTQIIIEEVSIRDISASAYITGVLMRLKLEDIVYESFNEKFMKNKAGVAGDVIKVLVMTFLKTVLANKDIMKQGAKVAGQELLGKLGFGKKSKEKSQVIDSDEDDVNYKPAAGMMKRQGATSEL